MEQSGGSEVCRLNLLLRGPFMTEIEVSEVNEEIATIRRANFALGFGKSRVKFQCTRSFGPHLHVFGMDGSITTPRKGNPLGKGPRRLPRHLLTLDDDNSYSCTASCPASRFSLCTGRCLLCHVQVEALAVNVAHVTTLSRTNVSFE